MAQTRGSGRVAVGGCAVGLAVGWNHTAIGAVADIFARDYGVSLGVVGLFTAALFVVHAACQIPAGRVVDALGARYVALVALSLLVAANALALLAPEPSLVLGARALTGLGTGVGFVAGIDYVRAEGGSPFAQGAFGGSTIGGAGLALVLVPALGGPVGWRAPFLGAIALAIVAALLISTGASGKTRTRGRLNHRVLVLSAGQARPLYRLCLLSMVSFGLSIVVANWIVTLLKRSEGLDSGVAGAIGSAVLLGGIAGRPLGGWIGRRTPQRNRITVATSFGVAAVGCAALVSGGSTTVLIAGALVLGLAAGIPFAPLFSAAARAGPASPATSVAVVNLAANLFIVVGVPLVGLSFALPGDGRLGIGVAAALWLSAIVLVRGTRELDAAPGHYEAGDGRAIEAGGVPGARARRAAGPALRPEG